MINVGFIGLGGMGRVQIKSFTRAGGCRIVAGADLAAEAREKFTADHADAKAYENYHDLLGDERVQAVVVAAPTGLHLEVGLAVIASGRPLLMEKPLARTVPDCHELIEAARKKGTLLMAAQCRRFDPEWDAWSQPVRDGELGAPLLWRHVMAGPGPGRWFMDDAMGGGPLLDGAIHNYDFANLLWGDPQRVTARAIKLSPQWTAVDTATAIIEYPGGHQVMVSWSWGTHGGQLFDILGPKASVQLGPGRIDVSGQDHPARALYCLTRQDGEASLIQVPADPYAKYQRQAEHFLVCIADKETCRSPGGEAIKAVAVAEAIFESASNDGRPVHPRW